MQEFIELTSRWKIASQIGDSSGMGAVYKVIDENGSEAAMKFIPKVPGASRELLFEELSGSANIMPIAETGVTETHYVILMPLAECSLRGHLNANGGKLKANEAIEVIKQIATGLESLESTVVHRDLKPENILLFEGNWCIADFGIARYAEATTAGDTKKFAMTSPYASPEQWKNERATFKSDIYSLGIIGFEILKGSRPFPGPSREDFHEQHVSVPAPELGSGIAGLDSLISDCLRKSTVARPSPKRILERLQSSMLSGSQAIEKLRQIDQRIGSEQAEQEAQLSKTQQILKSRTLTFKDAEDMFEELVQKFKADAGLASDKIRINGGKTDVNLQLLSGELEVTKPIQAQPQSLGTGSGPYGNVEPFDVIAYATINLKQSSNGLLRTHSLWFCDAHEEGEYRWFELSFMRNALISGSMENIGLPPQSANVAFQRVIGAIQLSWGPAPCDHENSEEFINRWLTWFAQAAEGQYPSPRVIPDNPPGRNGWYRNS
jgi:serine/threonine protein kinase